MIDTVLLTNSGQRSIGGGASGLGLNIPTVPPTVPTIPERMQRLVVVADRPLSLAAQTQHFRGFFLGWVFFFSVHFSFRNRRGLSKVGPKVVPDGALNSGNSERAER